MVSHDAWQHTFQLFSKKPIVVEPVDAHLTSDAGLLPIRQFDQLIGLTEAMAGVLEDHRHASWTQHGFIEMLRSRVFGILAGYFRSERPRPARPVPLAAGIPPFRLRLVTSTVPMEPPAAAS